jgi:cold shock protein
MVMATGVVKIYNDSRGFGFIKPDDGSKDVFVHANELNAAGIGDGLKEGEKVFFEVADSSHARAKPGDKKAVKVKRL